MSDAYSRDGRRWTATGMGRHGDVEKRHTPVPPRVRLTVYHVLPGLYERRRNRRRQGRRY